MKHKTRVLHTFLTNAETATFYQISFYQLASYFSYYPGKVERAILFDVVAWDANCPMHIHQRVPKAKAETQIRELESRIHKLQLELETLRQE